MTWIKICGLTRSEDVTAAEKGGADALGFVLVETSPRAITLVQAADLIKLTELPAFVLTKDRPPADLIATVLATGASGVQPYGLHADDAAQAATEVGLMVLRPVALGDDLDQIPEAQYPLFDTKTPSGEGDGGRMLDPDLVPATTRPFILAGGLTAGNVAKIVAAKQPWGVDVSSGVETRPGIKDSTLIEAFVEAVRNS